MALTHLQHLESESIHIMRKVRFRALGCYPLTGALLGHSIARSDDRASVVRADATIELSKSEIA